MRTENSDFVETFSRESDVIFARKDCSMIEIDEQECAGLAAGIFEAIGTDAYFNGSVEYSCDRFNSTFTASLIIYRDQADYPEGKAKSITNVVPVWWEFCTWLPEGQKINNDLCFSDIRKYLVQPV